jgi:sugar O-acyltransferase (sialic acid O-acetyltransferase NeuD family)
MPVTDFASCEAIKRKGFECVSYVSSHAFVWHNVEIGDNCFILENNVVQYGVTLGNDIVLWSGNHIGHRTVIRDHVFISSHVVISGYCEIGEHCFLGVNSSVSDHIKVANDCLVGAGALIHKDTKERMVYAGNPAKAIGDSFKTFGVDADAETAESSSPRLLT